MSPASKTTATRHLQRDRQCPHRAGGQRSVDLAPGRGADLDHPQGAARCHPDRHGMARLPPLGVHDRPAEVRLADGRGLGRRAAPRSRQSPPARRADAATRPSSTTSMTSAIAGSTGSPLRTSVPVNPTSPIHDMSAVNGTRRRRIAAASRASIRCSTSSPIHAIRTTSTSRNGWMTTIPTSSTCCRSNRPEPHRQAAKRREGAPRPQQEKHDHIVIRRET